jgi:ribosomal protein S18 acetylase RimI-like enzyme
MAALALFGTVSGALSCWRLSTLLMAPRLEPRDVGRAMIDAIVARVQALGGRLLMAELPADAAFGRTLSLLRSTGFREEGRVRDFYRDGVSLLFLRREM